MRSLLTATLVHHNRVAPARRNYIKPAHSSKDTTQPKIIFKKEKKKKRRESPRVATKTQLSQKINNFKEKKKKRKEGLMLLSFKELKKMVLFTEQ